MVILSFTTKNSASRLKDAPITLDIVPNPTLQIPYKSIVLVDYSEDDTISLFKNGVKPIIKNLLYLKVISMAITSLRELLQDRRL